VTDIISRSPLKCAGFTDDSLNFHDENDETSAAAAETSEREKIMKIFEGRKNVVRNLLKWPPTQSER
jgi:hypothetical protein